MYRITTPQGESYLTEKVNYIRRHDSGVYLLTDVNHAEGVAYRGTPYLRGCKRVGTRRIRMDGGKRIKPLICNIKATTPMEIVQIVISAVTRSGVTAIVLDLLQRKWPRKSWTFSLRPGS